MRYANRLLIDGRLEEAANGKSLTTSNPATGEAICDVAEAGAEDVKQAVRAARRAFDEGPWRRLDATERGKRVRRVADLIRTRQNELAQLDSKDCRRRPGAGSGRGAMGRVPQSERDTKLGAIISGEQLAKIERYVKLGLEEGAKLRVGGAQPKLSGPLAHGFFYQPTVFTEVDNRMRLAQEEIFGPVLSVLRFNDEGDVVPLANQVMYGLAAAVWTNDLRRAHRLARQLQAGVIWVNTTTHFSWAAPYGGMKASGFGREMGLDAVQIYTHVKNVWVNLSPAPNPWAN